MRKMNRSWAMGIAVVLGGSVVVLSARAKPRQTQAQSEARREGKSTFDSVCSACHGLDGRGGERGPDVSTRKEVVSKTDAELLTVVKEGRPGKGMPAFGALGEKQVLALVRYLRELQGSGRQVLASGDPAAGREVFFGKAKCSECHMVGGRGGYFGIELTGFASRKSADELRKAILSPEQDRDPRKGPLTVKLASGTVLSGVPRNEDNFSLQLQTPDGAFHLLKKTDIVSLTRSGGAAMPDDHGRSLSARELDDLMSFLVRSAASGSSNNSVGKQDDGDDE